MSNKKCIPTESNVNKTSKQDSLKTESEWLTTLEAAEYLRTSPQTILNRVSSGQLTYYKDQRRNLYRRSDLREMLLHNQRGGSHGNQIR